MGGGCAGKRGPSGRAVLLPPQAAAALAACSLALLGGCAQSGPAASGAPGLQAAPSSRAGYADNPAARGPLYSLFHRALKSPEGAAEILRLHAQGSQIFRCESRPGGLRWAYRLPDAELLDDAGKPVGRHGANQTFEHSDGSRLIGEVVDNVPSPLSNALPWLLLKTRSFGKGVLTGVSYVQRINTTGGMSPDGCTTDQLNQVLRVSFTADFVFFQ
jgi:hypothetical protein